MTLRQSLSCLDVLENVLRKRDISAHRLTLAAVELGHWRCEFSSVFRSKTYTRHYLRNYPAAEPVAEFDDRNRLYSLKGAINYSAGHPGCLLRKS